MPALLLCLELGVFAALRDTLCLLTRARISARTGPDEIRMCDSFRAGQRLYSVKAPPGGFARPAQAVRGVPVPPEAGRGRPGPRRPGLRPSPLPPPDADESR